MRLRRDYKNNSFVLLSAQIQSPLHLQSAPRYDHSATILYFFDGDNNILCSSLLRREGYREGR